MQIRNSAEGYGIIAKTLHWLVALLIIAIWSVGVYMTDVPDSDTTLRSTLYSLHKSAGMAILMLVIIRYSWRLYDRSLSPATPHKILSLAAHTVHYALYVFMFIQPLSGWALSSAAGYPPSFFGLFTFPALVTKNPDMVSFYAEVHEIAAYILLGLFLLHTSAALFHHFVLKDKTLKRML